MKSLAEFPLVYVATPYSKYPGGIEVAFQDASAVTAQLVKAGVKAYSPIAHTHALAVYGDMDPFDYDIWLPFDEAMMAKSDAVVVAKMTGWETSFGIAHELEVFKKAGKPVFYLDPVTLEVETA